MSKVSGQLPPAASNFLDINPNNGTYSVTPVWYRFFANFVTQAITGTAVEGDLSGNWPILTVDHINGVPLGLVPATNGHLLTGNGTKWVSSTPKTVSSVTFTGDGTIFTSTPSTPVTTIGTLPASLLFQTPNTVLSGPSNGGLAAPTFRRLVGADMPVFPKARVYLGTNQTIPNNTATKITFDTTSFDTNSNFDTVTNHRFTPSVPGFYRVSCTAYVNTGLVAGDIYTLSLYQNGNPVTQNIQFSSGTSNTTMSMTVSDLIQMNGSSDYIECFISQVSGGNVTLNNGSISTYCTFTVAP